MKSQGEIEAAVCDGIARFQQEFIGRGPRDIHAHLIGQLVVVRLQGVLTPAERQLIAEPSTVSEASDAEAGAVAAGPATVAHGGAPAGNGTSSGNGRSLLKQVR
ncbi:MAG: Na-translocating system protein MpsC family protein, partial [Pirellulales bacterium]